MSTLHEGWFGGEDLREWVFPMGDDDDDDDYDDDDDDDDAGDDDDDDDDDDDAPNTKMCVWEYQL